MPHHCCVPQCVTNSGKVKASWHKFPEKGTSLRRQWVHAVRRENLIISVHTKVCSRHFVDTDYCQGTDRAAKRRKGTSTPKRLLKGTAVPSVFPWTKAEKEKRHPPKDRSAVASNLVLETVVSSGDAQPTETPGALENVGTPELRTEAFSDQDWKQKAMDMEAENASLKHALCAALQQVSSLQQELVAVKSAAHDVFLTDELRVPPAGVPDTASIPPSLKRQPFCLDDIAHDDKLVRFYTGLPSLKYFQALYAFVEDSVEGLVIWNGTRTSTSSDDSTPRSRCLSGRNELLLVLMKLRLNCPYEDLAMRFGVSTSTISRLFTSWLMLLYRKLRVVTFWPTRAQVDAAMPPQFKDLYPTTRVVIDCTEFPIEKPSDPDTQRATWSSYKNRNTFKLLVGASPSGGITFLSSLYGGSVSDNEITLSSGLLDKLEPGDSIMADKGFLIAPHCASRNVTLNIPPRLGKDSQLSAADMVETRRIASLRVHVERVMERIKNYHILDFFDSHYFDIADAIVFVCAFVSNFQPPLVQ